MSEKNMTDLERALSALTPAATTLNRDALLFRAGQASVPPSRVWPLVSLATSAVALTLALVPLLRPVPGPVVHYVHVPMQVAPAAVVATSATVPPAEPLPGLTSAPIKHVPTLSYWHLQQQALRFGVDSLPSSIVAFEEQPADPAAQPAASDPFDFSAGARPTLFPLPPHKSGE